MARNTERAVSIQRQYYAETAAEYDAAHELEGDNDPRILRLVRTMLRMVDAKSVLDVGAGTGRGVRHLIDNMPGLTVRGIEPVAERIEQAVKYKGIPEGTILQGVGEKLPFENRSFDAACAFGMIHHLPRPNDVVREMIRVARKMVIIADGNRFGQGPWPLRLFKLALYKAGLWQVARFVRTGGKGYIVSEGDGVHFSYSVFDSLAPLEEWADHLMLIPTGPCKSRSMFQPLLTASSILVCAVKEIDEAPAE
jgi:ubiquinone/menaquinone biosynthesis C-methylase UbiE